MKVSLRKGVREAIGDLIRPEQVERAGVLTITGLLPSPINTEPAAEPSARLETEPGRPAPVEQEQAEIETAFKRRVRYLLTLKGRPPFRLAGIEMYERLSEVSACLAAAILILNFNWYQVWA
jgi:hypothetical protein